MNQQWQPPSRIPGPPRAGGSVKRAREGLAAGLPPDAPLPQPGRLHVPPRMPAPNQPPSRIRPPMPIAFSGPERGQVPIGVAISRPTPIPQWPLAAAPEPGPRYQPPVGRGPPPQRPPRPSQVPSVLEISRLQTDALQRQEEAEQQDERERREEGDLISPIVTSPMTSSSRPSTFSSVGSIPDFPVPAAPLPPRRSANLGPPPSSRRGASSYYSQASFVSPIPEESPRSRTTHLSYASSAAIPTSWRSNSPRYPFGDDEDESPYDTKFDGLSVQAPTAEEGRESRGSADDGDDRGLIRSASFGRRAKPSMVTTRSPERGEPRPAPAPQQRPTKMTKLDKMEILPFSDDDDDDDEDSSASASKNDGPEREELQTNAVWPIIGNAYSPLATGTGLIDRSNSSSSQDSASTVAMAVTTNDAAPAHTAKLSDPNASAMLGAYYAASSLQPPRMQPTPTRGPVNGFNRLSAIRRPPRLDMNAVRDAEARGSLTSLPDLIRRATKLASMMERGKRPGSRLILDDFPSQDGFPPEKDRAPPADEKRRSDFAGMLAAFPSPGFQTPRAETPPRPISVWPSGTGLHDGVRQGEWKPKTARRCCGLPCWGFVVVVLLILIIIAAAIIVPLDLLVFNKSDSSTGKAVTAASCQARPATECKNGGTALVDNGACACICTNGFTGSTCTSANATGCATVTITGSSLTNVTLGQSISRLISGGQTNFSIPLSEPTILARFNSANLSCATENALVTFQGRSERLGSASDPVVATRAASSSSTSAPNARIRDVASPSSPEPALESTNGIVYDGSTPSWAPASSSSPTSTPAPNATFRPSEEALDFSRVAVLYVLQQDALEAAIAAQSALQAFFSCQDATNQAAANVSLGHGNALNLVAFQVEVGNRAVGARNSSLAVRARRDPELGFFGRSALLLRGP